MSKYDNYIFLTICEVTLDAYNNSNYSTYAEYCKGFAISLENGQLNSREKHTLVTIMSCLDKVFSLTDADTSNYISAYFSLPPIRHTEFQSIVRQTNKLFPEIKKFSQFP